MYTNAFHVSLIAQVKTCTIVEYAMRHSAARSVKRDTNVNKLSIYLTKVAYKSWFFL